MKPFALFIASILLVCSCSKKNNIHPVTSQTTVVKDAGTIAFKAIPLADNQLKILLQNSQAGTLPKMILKLDTVTLATVSSMNDSAGIISGTFNYNFQAGKKYDILVQKAVAGDTIYQYKITGYQHQYASHFSYNKILSLHQSLGPNDFDITPSHNFIFIADDITNNVRLNRINLQTLTVDSIDYDIAGGPVRAISDHELLVYGGKSTKNLPAIADPGNDATILARYDINLKSSAFVDYVSNGYGRLSRVINNHVLVTNPVFTASTASLINLGDLSRVKYSLNNFDFTRINQYSFGHIIYENMLVSTSDGSMSTPVSLGPNSGLIEVDDATGYLFAGSAKTGAANQISTAYSIFKGNAAVYQSDYGYGRSVSFPIIFNIKNDVVTFYQYFGYDTKVNIDGYYSLNLKTQEIKLIQADSNPYVVSDYQLKDGSVFSIRADGVYKLIPVN